LNGEFSKNSDVTEASPVN